MKGNEGSGGALQRAQRRLQISFVIRSYCDSTRWISILRHDLATVSPATPPAGGAKRQVHRSLGTCVVLLDLLAMLALGHDHPRIGHA